MEFSKRIAGEIDQTVWLQIDPKIVETPGTLFCSRVSNSDGATTVRLEDLTIEDMDAEIVFRFNDWKNPVVRERLNAAQKYELLIPNMIPAELIEF